MSVYVLSKGSKFSPCYYMFLVNKDKEIGKVKITIYKNGKELQMEKQFAERLVENSPEVWSFREKEVVEDDEITERELLFNQYKEKFGKFPPKNIGLEKLKDKLKDE